MTNHHHHPAMGERQSLLHAAHVLTLPPGSSGPPLPEHEALELAIALLGMLPDDKQIVGTQITVGDMLPVLIASYQAEAAALELADAEAARRVAERSPLTPARAILHLQQGHGVTTVAHARKIANALGVSLDERIICRWLSSDEAANKYGVFPTTSGPGDGVGLLELGYSICRALGIEAQGAVYTGKGFQARANAAALAEHFHEDGEGGTSQRGE